MLKKKKSVEKKMTPQKLPASFEFLEEILKEIIRTKDIRSDVMDIFGMIGEHLAIDHILLCEMGKESNHIGEVSVYEWTRGTFPEQRYELVSMDHTDGISAWKDLFEKQAYLFSSDIATLPDILRESISPKTNTILVIPLFIEEKFFGCIRFENMQETSWTDEEIHFLSLVSLLIGTSLSRIEYETLLQDKEEKLRFVIDSAEIAIWTASFDVPKFVSKAPLPEVIQYEFDLAFETLLGYAQGTLENNYTTWESLVHPEDFPKVQQDIKAYLFDRKSDDERYQMEYRLKTFDGKWKWVLSKGRIVSEKSSKEYLFMRGIHIDIDHIKQLEGSLQEELAQVEKMNEIMRGRELRMIELKEEIAKLKGQQ